MATVTIGAVEKYITDTAGAKGWVKPIVPRWSGINRLAIIGAGPGGSGSGLIVCAAAACSASAIYDRYDRAGGLLRLW